MVLGKNRLSVDVCSQHLDLTNDETLFYFKTLLQVRISKEEEFFPSSTGSGMAPTRCINASVSSEYFCVLM